MKIVTLTLSPAFDIHCHTPSFLPYHENLAKITDFDAGGKGVNISRALTVMGVENLAVVVLGDENGDAFRRALLRDGIAYREITVPGRIRENITLHTDGAPETRISFEGFSISAEVLSSVKEVLFELLKSGDILTFTGRVPSGASMEEIKALLRELGDLGVRIVIDSRSFALSDLVELRPFLIKPNEEEISAYLEREITDFETVRSSAQDLARGGIENVMISLGAKGAMLATATDIFECEAPEIEAISTIGAGDSSIAGFLAAFQAGETPELCLKSAVAYGSAACLTSGTRPPRYEDVKRFCK